MNTLLYFTADWCNPCKRVRPIVEDLERDNAITVLYIDVDDNVELVETYGIRSVPTLILIKDKEEVGRISGSKTRDELEAFINER